MKISARQLLEQSEGLAVEYSRAALGGITRRQALSFGATAAALFGVAGGTFLDGARHGARAEQVKGAAGDTVLTLLHAGGPWLEFDKLWAVDYLKLNPEIKDIVFDVFNYDEGFQKQTLAFSRGDSSFDMLQIDEPWLPSHANGGHLYDARNDFASIADPAYDWDDYHQAGLEAGQWKGVQYGIPSIANTLGLIYRKDLYQEAGLALPTTKSTWSDFEAALKVLHKPEKKQYGFASIHQRGDLNTTDWMTVAQSWLAYPNNQFYDEKTWQPRMAEDFSVESLEMYIHLMESYSQPGALGISFTEFVPDYQQGRLAHMIFWASWWGLDEDPKTSTVVGKNGWSTPYAGEHGVAASHRGYWLWALSKKSKNPERAYKFAEYLSNKANYCRSALKGILYSRKSLYADAEIQAKYPFYGQQQENLDAVLKQHAYRPRLPEFIQLNDVLTSNLAAACAREVTAKEATQKMAMQSERLLKRWGYLKA